MARSGPSDHLIPHPEPPQHAVPNLPQWFIFHCERTFLSTHSPCSSWDVNWTWTWQIIWTNSLHKCIPVSHFLTAVHFTSNFKIFTFEFTANSKFELNTWVATLLLVCQIAPAHLRDCPESSVTRAKKAVLCHNARQHSCRIQQPHKSRSDGSSWCLWTNNNILQGARLPYDIYFTHWLSWIDVFPVFVG